VTNIGREGCGSFLCTLCPTGRGAGPQRDESASEALMGEWGSCSLSEGYRQDWARDMAVEFRLEGPPSLSWPALSKC